MRNFFLLIVGLNCMLASAQMTLEKRVEFELKNGYEEENLIQSIDGSFILSSRAEKAVNKWEELRFDLYNSDLQLIKTSSILIPEKMTSVKVFSDEQSIYQLFKNDKREFLFYGISKNSLDTFSVKGVIPKGVYIIDMKVLEKKAWFEVVKSGKNCIMQVDLTNGKVQFSEKVQDVWSKKSRIVNYQFASDSEELLMFVNKTIKKGVCELYQVRVNDSCMLCDNVALTGANDKVISSISGYRVSPEKLIYAGTYSDSYQSRSQGIYLAESEKGKLNFIKYVNFLNMKNFLSFLPKRTKEYIEKKKSKMADEGKELTYDYQIVTHNIISLANSYLLVGEAYYPTYTSVPQTTTMMINGRATTQTIYVNVFDGYNYTHAFVACFSNQGELQWDQSFEMSPLRKPMTVRQFLRVSTQDNEKLTMVYANGNYLVSKTIGADGIVVSEKKESIITTEDQNEKSSWTFSNAEYWYDNKFLVYGYQTVKDKVEKSKRRVFFINKVAF